MSKVAVVDHTFIFDAAGAFFLAGPRCASLAGSAPGAGGEQDAGAPEWETLGSEMCEGFAIVVVESIFLSFTQFKALLHCGDSHHSTDNIILTVWHDLALFMVKDAVKVGVAEHEGRPDKDKHQHSYSTVGTQCE